MDRKLWLSDTKNKPCPTCRSGRLTYDSRRAILSETKESLERNEYHNNGTVAPDSDFLVSAHLSCDECKDVVTVIYERLDDVRHTDENGFEISIWTPIIYHPAPYLIDVPTALPDNVKKHLIKSFGLFWYDQASCGNKIRVALEKILDSFGLQSQDATGKFITLGSRLQTFAGIKPETKSFLEAIRWLGNSASHDDKLTKEDLLDAYELIELSLELLYKEKENSLLTLSQQIIANKGPIQR
ncbi:DUF4145 domain-containing protein [Chitinophaga sp. G-6-1-13]|uniref:DUF4145 domain-containing protein n=1 Tax=Chitinophaga fulva TaxID=2728842 RepID=A0A848GQN4_9BACT|nr:DUF4145 domain-containing protein [Chitinophaga fulva]NML40856.1 DUF4145 domain-containing protein [Chitinophaga fulva]